MSAQFSVDSGEIIGDGPLLYGDFMMPNTDNKNYEEITDMDKVREEVVNICTYTGHTLWSVHYTHW